MKTRFVYLFLCFSLSYFAQQDYNEWPKEEQKKLENAKYLMDDKLYLLAHERFDALLKLHPDNTYVKYLTGICAIYLTDKREEAAKYLAEVKTANSKAVDLDYYYAIFYHRNYEFDKCIELANKLIYENKLDPEKIKTLNQLVKYCDNAKKLVGFPLNIKIDDIGSPPNTEFSEYAPVLTSDEETMYFTYRGKGCKGDLQDFKMKPNPEGFYFEDIYKSTKLNGAWQKPESIGDINTNTNDAVVAISNDGQQMFIFRADEKDGGDIYVSHLKGNAFSTAERIQGDINTLSWEGSISMSGDQKRVIFASERIGGYGGKDLYSADLQPDGSWRNVKNLGDAVNTGYDDDAPFIHPDGRTLIFSSKGHNSMGEYDIFISDLNEKDSTWMAPQNIGYPINTTDDDIDYFISADGKKGYYATNKKNSIGDKDIYVVEPALPNKKSYLTIIKGKITENMTPFAGDVSVSLGDRGYGKFQSNSASGAYLVSLPSGYNYKLSFSHPVFGVKTVDLITEKLDGYAEKVVDVNFSASDTMGRHQTIVLETPPPKKDSVPPAPVTEDLSKMSNEQLLEKFGNVKVDGVVYKVQVGAYKDPTTFSDEKLRGICKVKHNGLLEDGSTIIQAVNDFETWKEAEDLLKAVRNAGHTDAFLTPYINGKRHYMEDLVKMQIWIKK